MATAFAMGESIRLTERAELGGNAKVNRSANVIRGVKICGFESKNGRTYTRDALQRAIGLYEGVGVNVDHPQSKSAPRSYADRIGHLRSVRLESTGLFGDLHYNPKHHLAEQFVHDAEFAPNRVGLSHNIEGRTRSDGGKLIIEAITRVVSVDLVADPATTAGLYESTGHGRKSTIAEMQLEVAALQAEFDRQEQASQIRESAALGTAPPAMQQVQVRKDPGLSLLEKDVLDFIRGVHDTKKIKPALAKIESLLLLAMERKGIMAKEPVAESVIESLGVADAANSSVRGSVIGSIYD